MSKSRAVVLGAGITTINYTGGIVDYTAPAGTYNIIAYGADGGSGGGLGAEMGGEFQLSSNDTIEVLIGGSGGAGFGGGGGGSFLASSASNPVEVAGGNKLNLNGNGEVVINFVPAAAAPLPPSLFLLGAGLGGLGLISVAKRRSNRSRQL